jgi:catechol 2,3-dioxygenase-like lactoylglutathione lyase family enzyme
MPRIDHVSVPARDPEASAGFLADVLGLDRRTAVGPDGPGGDMVRVELDGAGVLFVADPTGGAPHHVAFSVPGDAFARVVERLRRRRRPFGNDPEDPANGLTFDPRGSGGRIYLVDPDGHLFEVTVVD